MDDDMKGFFKSVWLIWLLAILGNLLFWGGLIAATIWALSTFVFN
jgi:hypothetical protein